MPGYETEDAILLTCACGQKLKARPQQAGKIMPCPRCEAPVAVPHPTPDADAWRPAPEKPRRTRIPLRVRISGVIAGVRRCLHEAPQAVRALAWFAFVGLALGVTATLGDARHVVWLLGDALCLLAAFALTFVAWPRWRKWWLAVALIPGCGATHWIDEIATYRTSWEKDGYEYFDAYDRSRTLLHRSVSHHEDGVHFSASGDFSGSGKQHGEWTYFSFRPGGAESETHWFWYGEEITEGEWRLRNR